MTKNLQTNKFAWRIQFSKNFKLQGTIEFFSKIMFKLNLLITLSPRKLYICHNVILKLVRNISDPVHDPEKHDPEWTQSRMDTIPNGHHPEWTPSRMDTIPNGHHPKWAPSRMDTIPKGHNPE